MRDSVEDLRSIALANGRPAALLIIFRQPGANIIDTVDRIRATLPELHALAPAAVVLTVVLDQTVTIRASVHDVEVALAIAVGLVILVVYLCLRDVRATAIPGVVVPVSLVGTFAFALMSMGADKMRGIGDSTIISKVRRVHFGGADPRNKPRGRRTVLTPDCDAALTSKVSSWPATTRVPLGKETRWHSGRERDALDAKR